jgi:uncharacterized protein (TIGR00299 family) protein
MRTLYLDTFSGISGDMMLGLLIDLGVDFNEIKQELGKLPISGYRLEQRQEKRHGIGGIRVEVFCDGRQPSRTWQNIDTLITDCSLSQSVKEIARKTFRSLGEAEAHVHKTTLNDVHFHEVGAVDAIVDIVGSAIGLDLLGVDNVISAPLPLSSGMTKGSHGAIPLPAPATVQILTGAPVRDAASDKELVTPTGAAIAANVADFTFMPAMKIERIGYGVGGWELEDRPNLLRGIVGETSSDNDLETDQVTVIETHIDDSPAEWLGSLIDLLLSSGALDAAFTSLQMKKNRPGVRLTVIAKPADAPMLAKTILRESSAIGVRMHDCRRMKLRREPATIETGIGSAAIKLIYEGDQLLRITAEHASCMQLARDSGKPLPDIYRIVTAAANQTYGLEE